MGNFTLIGMPAVGKSTLGVLLAKEIGYDFIDTDLIIQKECGKLLKEIIEEEGNEGFCDIEDKINAAVDVENCVISPGGSIVYCENAMKHFKEIGAVVYLKASYEEIEKRLEDAVARGVVMKEGQTLKNLYDERVLLFEKYADLTVSEEGLNPDQTTDKLVKMCYEYLKNSKKN
ncbi:MAG: shikimate kinase [Lachnospiraceae bacterium]|jgi:shikimate kinase|nr:shikimate kinase [Lachnospiraceae bacterium]